MSALKAYLVRSPYLLFLVHALRSLLHGQKPFMPALRNAAYDSQTLQVMRRVLRADSICVDGGAHHGAILEQMVSMAPKARHYAFEPLQALYNTLRQRYPDQHVLACALGEQAGEATFQHVVDAPAYSGLQRRTYDHPDPQVQEIRVEVARLDDLIPATERLAFIKLDLEGGEYHALRGGMETIRRCRPVIVFEAGGTSSGHYGVTPEMIHALITSELQLNLSTMARWLAGKSGFDLDTFLQYYPNEFVFIAYP
jgi:FkbM family methyltransferase